MTTHDFRIRGGKLPAVALFGLALWFGGPPTHAAESDVLATRTYGSEHSELARASQALADGGLLLAGTSGATSFGDTDVELLRLDASGTPVWQSLLGGAANEQGLALAPGPDDGWYVAGSTDLGIPPTRNGMLQRVDAQGNLVWQKQYGGSAADVLRGVAATADGGCVAVGETASAGTGGYAFWALRVDADGEVIWESTLGGSNEHLEAVAADPWGNFYACGWEQAGGGLTPPFDAVLVRIGAAGGISRLGTYDNGEYDRAYAVHALPDGDVLMTGTSGGAMSLWRLTPSGAVRWRTPFQTDSLDTGTAVTPTSDGGFLVGGFVYGEILVGKTGADGQRQWFRQFGSTGSDVCTSVRETADGDYAVVGYTNSEGAGAYDFYLILLEGAPAPSPVPDLAPTVAPAVAASPNPFNPRVQLALSGLGAGRVDVAIHDPRGRLVRRLVGTDSARLTWDGRDESGAAAPSGLYLVTARSATRTARTKILLAR